MILSDEGYFSDPADLELTKNAFKIYVKDIVAKLSAIDPSYQLLSPTPDILDDDAKLEAFIKQTMLEAYHEQGTLRMAPSPDEGVVNSRGEVFGVEDLIVADNSIMPFPVDGNTQAPAYLMGLTIAKQLLLGN
ncbi:MAG: GMC family oxidoreductase [Desulfosporosinus sp.]|jgi:choline dehydrogenase